MKYDVFISYRRDGGGEFARSIKAELELRGYSVFLDFDELKDGVFDERILEAIESSPVFLFILSNGSLDRCMQEGDWVRKEVEHAYRHNRHIIPVNKDGAFVGIPEELPDILAEVFSRNQYSDIMLGQLFGSSIEKMVKDLLLQGFPAEIVQSWLNEVVKLSRLRITRQFKILLVDYDMEIKMGPLPKTVFLFYLRHPEGVKFTYLQDHVDELRNIYGHVSVNDDPVKMDESIASLTDPLNNSICEKCAAIKKAFMLKVHDNVARNYYITGMQGGEKGIALDRNLVEWECQL